LISRWWWGPKTAGQIWTKDRSVRSFDGANIRYTVLGPQDAPVVAFCAGFLCPDTYWKYIVPALQQDFRLIVWNYRGIGVSELPRPPGFHAVNIAPDELSVEVNARDLAAILDGELVDRVALVGHSMGVQVILEAYERYPDRIAALASLAGPYETPLRTFYGTNASAVLAPVALPLLHLLPRTSLVAWRALVHNPLAFPAGRLVRAIGPRVKADDMTGYFDHVSLIDPLIIAKMIRGMHAHSAEELLPKIDVPVLIAHGTSDPFTPIGVAREMADRIPDAKLIVFDGGSHTLPIEYPDEITAELRPFLEDAFSRS
jgi:3-oxoadipate enol-lactonase